MPGYVVWKLSLAADYSQAGAVIRGATAGAETASRQLRHLLAQVGSGGAGANTNSLIVTNGGQLFATSVVVGSPGAVGNQFVISGAGTATVLATKGKDVKFEAEQRFSFVLQSELGIKF